MGQDSETIVAVATAPGRGGIGVVRVSGPEAQAIIAPLLRLRNPLAAGRARFAEILDLETGEVLDEGVVTLFVAPHSYTAEDVVEIAAHGSPVLLEYLLRACCARGARLAEAGEFTQRAFLSGRLDLTQAEAVEDLIGSSTLEQARVAARQLGGALSKQVQPVKERLVLLIATLEAGIDFAEDDIEVLSRAVIVALIAEIEVPLEELQRGFAYGRVLRDGFTLALVGRPNAGKSSLFNRLLAKDRAIVTAMPGTTRDVIAERMSLGGIPVELLDTAGLRDADQDAARAIDEAERLGMVRSREAMAEASVLLLVVDATRPVDAEDLAILQAVEPRTLVVVLNKTDLVAEAEVDESVSAIRQTAHVARTSALTGEGIDELRELVLKILQADAAERSVTVTNMRQQQAISASLLALGAAQAATGRLLPHEMILLDLYEALRLLDELTGSTTNEDVLKLIFGRFCIGK